MNFDASASFDHDGSITAYLWDFADGSAPVETSSPQITHTFTDAGQFQTRQRINERIAFRIPALTNFLKNDSDGEVTLIITRETSIGDSGRTFRIASRENTTNFPPTLNITYGQASGPDIILRVESSPNLTSSSWQPFPTLAWRVCMWTQDPPRCQAVTPKMSKPAPHPLDSGSSSPESHREKDEKQTKLVAPTKAETALLPAFPGLPPEQIHVPRTRAQCQNAVDEILAAGMSGFDTEAKPTFKVGEKSKGPHVVQFALTDKAFIFQLHWNECEKAAANLIASERILKVGFGLKNDHGQIRNRLETSLNHVLDLDQIFRKLGYRGQIGVRGAIGVLLKQGFKKSKSITTSNWALPELTSQQLLYAANDAFAALKIMEALQKEGHLND